MTDGEEELQHYDDGCFGGESRQVTDAVIEGRVRWALENADFIRAFDGVRRETGWQPIETAPKDGTLILMFWPESVNNRTLGHVISTGSIDDDWWDVDNWTAGKILDEGATKPTHWMPLPPAPPTT
ncbi:hypothetical protein KLEP181_gp30 [Paracoccus phage vB_PmaP_KLEP18-1]|nr:hypothetical protein KLEP181_gp30 [Paracoccus phage vB_PmaP_KLEP18-1]